MLIYKVKEVLSRKGVTPYRLYTDKVLTNPTWKNFKKGGDLSLKVLDKLCNYLNCDLDDLVEYAEDDSFEANSYLIKKAIEEKNFGEEFETLCQKIDCWYKLMELSKLYGDCFDDVKEEEILGLMYDVIDVERIKMDFDIAVENAKKNPKISKRFQHLENLKDLHEELVDKNYVIQADGSLSRLCNLRDSYCFGELLDCYLDEWREENTQYDEESEVVGIDYLDYDITNYEIIPQLSDDEFKDLVDVIDNAFWFEKDEFDSYINDFIEKFENEDNE